MEETNYFTIHNFTEEDEGEYHCIVNDSNGEVVVSDIANLYLPEPITITAQIHPSNIGYVKIEG